MSVLRVDLVDQFGPVANGEDEVTRKDEVERVLFPRPLLLNVVEFEAAVWRHPALISLRFDMRLHPNMLTILAVLAQCQLPTPRAMLEIITSSNRAGHTHIGGRVHIGNVDRPDA